MKEARVTPITDQNTPHSDWGEKQPTEAALEPQAPEDSAGVATKSATWPAIRTSDIESRFQLDEEQCAKEARRYLKALGWACGKLFEYKLVFTLIDKTKEEAHPDGGTDFNATSMDISKEDEKKKRRKRQEESVDVRHVGRGSLHAKLPPILKKSGACHIYYKMAFFNPNLNKRSAGREKDVIGIPGFWVEIDYGPHHAELNTPETADEALSLAKKAFESLAPSMICASGGGLYLFWLFEKPWFFKENKERAKALWINKSLHRHLSSIAAEHGWRVDCLANLDRMLRLPGTKNIKDPENHKTAHIVHLDDELRYTPDDIRLFLAGKGALVEEPKAKKRKTKLHVVKRSNATPKAGAPGGNQAYDWDESEEDKPEFESIFQKCPFIKHCVDDAGDLPEPDWFAMVSVSCRCKDGIRVTHEASRPYDGYDEGETDEKIERSLRSGGPLTCAKISESTGDMYCSTCHHQGKIKSPIVLGRPRKKNKRTRDQILELNETYAVITVGGKVLILEEQTNPLTGYPDFVLLKKQDFELKLANRTVLEMGTNGEPREVPLAKAWLKHPERREYNGIVFDPYGKAGSEYFNMFQGYAIKPKYGNWERMRRHILNVICGGEEVLFQYVLAWMAYIFQNPGGPKPGIALVLRGLEGTGKSFFAKRLLKMVGVHGIHIANQGQLTGRFNQHLRSCLICYCDEGFWAGDKAAEGVLKALITEDTIQIEPKGKDSYPVANHVNLIISSNNDWVVPAGFTARRFLVLDVSGSHMQDTEYFRALADEMDNGGDEAMLYDLLQMDISDIDLRKVPRTKALLDQMVHSCDPVQLYWFERLHEGALPEIDKVGSGDFGDAYECVEWLPDIPKEILHQHYLQFCRRHNLRRPDFKPLFFKKLKSLCPGLENCRPTVGSKRIHALRVPDLCACRSAFEKVVAMPIEWDEPAEEVEQTAFRELPSIDDDSEEWNMAI